jgi:hypothetical protein
MSAPIPADPDDQSGFDVNADEADESSHDGNVLPMSAPIPAGPDDQSGFDVNADGADESSHDGNVLPMSAPIPAGPDGQSELRFTSEERGMLSTMKKELID